MESLVNWRSDGSALTFARLLLRRARLLIELTDAKDARQRTAVGAILKRVLCNLFIKGCLSAAIIASLLLLSLRRHRLGTSRGRCRHRLLSMPAMAFPAL